MSRPEPEPTALRHAVLRLNARAWGIALGLLFGSGLFLATLILVLKGGPNVGQHLNLLSAYFPGYRVTFLGAFVGFAYAFVLGYGLGRLVGAVYNRLVGPPLSPR
ncbi:MAG: bacteriophage holin [Longimicrobiales bacterium]